LVGQGLIEVGHGIVEVTSLFAGQTAGDAGGRVVGVDFQGAVEVGQGTGQVALLLPQQAAIVQDRDGCVTHGAGQGTIEIGGRGVELAQGLKSPAAVVEGVHVIGLAGQSLVEVCKGGPVLAEHVPHQTGVVPGCGPLGSESGGRVESRQGAGAIANLKPGNAAADGFLRSRAGGGR
jgi:hypothetical protein